MTRVGAPGRKSPWTYVPSLYFQQGLPVILVQQFSVLLYKRLGVPNEQIGLWTSLLAWPWIIKMLWGPLVDLIGTKRGWVLGMQLAIVAMLLLSAFALLSPSFFQITLGLFFVTAFLSATHDIALDGYYLLALEGTSQQAYFLGIRTSFFRLAMVFCTGALVILAGLWEKWGLSVADSWMRAVLVGAVLYGTLSLYATRAMPKLAADRAASRVSAVTRAKASYLDAFRTFFGQKDAVSILLFILLYRFGESMLSKMSGLFLLDAREAGGLGFDTVQAGTIIGTCGVLSLVTGGVLGGMAVARFGIRACMWPMALMMALPNLMYVWAAYAQPGPLPVYILVSVDQFAYGFGLASYMAYAMYVCQSSRYQASHFAIVTGLMALGAMTAGVVSGYLQAHLGYFWFFVAVCICTLPGMALLYRIPFDDEKLVAASALASEAEA